MCELYLGHWHSVFCRISFMHQEISSLCPNHSTGNDLKVTVKRLITLYFWSLTLFHTCFLSFWFSWQVLRCWLWAFGCVLTPGQQDCLKERTRLQSSSLVRPSLTLHYCLYSFTRGTKHQLQPTTRITRHLHNIICTVSAQCRTVVLFAFRPNKY